MNEIDRLIAMLEPSASENTVLFVRNELRNLIRGVWSNDYVPQENLGDIAALEVKDNQDTAPQSERTDQQRVDPFDNGEYHPNDPRNW